MIIVVVLKKAVKIIYKIKKGLTDKEKLYFENKKIKEEHDEYLRLERIKQNDIKIKINNEKASRLFIK